MTNAVSSLEDYMHNRVLLIILALFTANGVLAQGNVTNERVLAESASAGAATKTDAGSPVLNPSENTLKYRATVVGSCRSTGYTTQRSPRGESHWNCGGGDSTPITSGSKRS